MRSAASLARSLRGQSRAFRAQLREAPAVQERQLRGILARHAGCEYGRQHGFAAIAGYDDYRRRVPVVDAEGLRPWIDRMAAGEDGVLLADRVVAYEETGGSTAGPKLVPYGEEALAAFRRGLLPWLDDVYAAHPGMESGTAYWSISPACRAPRLTPGDIPIGLESDAAYLGAELAPHLAESLAVPPEIGAVADIESWRRLTCTHLLADAHLTLISIWNPTFLTQLLAYMQENAGALTEGLADRARARTVLAALAAAAPDVEAMWPALRVISCWDDAAARVPAQALRRLFPHAVMQGKGLLATEGLVSIPLSGQSRPVLAIASGFYEFVDGTGRALAAHEVRAGETYDLLLTNHSGLYRYAIGDRVRVHGFAAAAPLLEFVGRAGVSDLCGEKVSEGFAVQVLGDCGLRFAALAAQPHPAPGYVLLVDAAEVSAAQAATLGREIDAALCADPQYEYARRLRQLQPLQAMRCHRPLQGWLDARLARGQRLGDIKPCALITEADWRDHFREAP